ncbi:MAG TPA: MerR family transcriptional regulator [Oligoflexia bacterium]|nr:MerR family transcriptional regulator [Oligoflexia bacterium]
MSQTFNVKAAANMSALTTHTLRAWERRYGVVTPRRSANGRRLYTMEDVEKLRLLGQLVEAGHSIGQLAELSPAQLRSLEKSQHSAPDRSHEVDFLEKIRRQLIKSVEQLDFDEMDRLILQARISTPLREFVLQVVAPLLTQVGYLVHTRKLDVAQEHAFSAVLRNHLGELLSQVQKTNDWRSNTSSALPRFLFSTPEGDLHEFGILLAAILTGSRGFKFRYLGANMPAVDLGRAVLAVKAQIVVLGAVEADETRLKSPLKEYITELGRELQKEKLWNPMQIKIWIGGQCDFDLKKHPYSAVLFHTRTLLEFDRQLDFL